MARDGTGQYNLPNAVVVTATPISSVDENGTRADLATALTNSVARNGEGGMTGALVMGGNSITAMANGAARNAAANVGQLQDGGPLWGGTAGGTANALTIAPTPAITAYAAGQMFHFLSGASANTAAVTLAVNALTSPAITKGDGASALVAGDIPAGTLVSVQHDGTRFRLANVRTPFGATLGVAADAAQARSLLLAAPIPAVSGVGTWVQILAATANPLVLPANGTWAWFFLSFRASTSLWGGVYNAGISAGGTEIAIGVTDTQFIGFAWRTS